MPAPLTPTNVFSANGWYFEIQGLVSPHFNRLSGIKKSTGEVSIVDGSTGIRHKFANQIKEFGDITLVRAYDGSVDDNYMRQLTKLSLDGCTKFDGNLVKLQCGKEVFRIIFLGMKMKDTEHPELRTDSEERYDVQYMFSVTEWQEIPI
jgi:hypothetical protein